MRVALVCLLLLSWNSFSSAEPNPLINKIKDTLANRLLKAFSSKIPNQDLRRKAYLGLETLRASNGFVQKKADGTENSPLGFNLGVIYFDLKTAILKFDVKNPNLWISYNSFTSRFLFFKGQGSAEARVGYATGYIFLKRQDCNAAVDFDLSKFDLDDKKINCKSCKWSPTKWTKRGFWVDVKVATGAAMRKEMETAFNGQQLKIEGYC